MKEEEEMQFRIYKARSILRCFHLHLTSLGSDQIDSTHFEDRLLKVTIPSDRVNAMHVRVCR